jgi:hypothetical protein
VSEQQAEQTSGEPGSLNAEPALPLSSHVPSEPAAASAPEMTEVESPRLVPEQAAAAETRETDAAKADAPEFVASKRDAAPGKIMIMSSGDRAWESHSTDSKAETEQSQDASGKRRLSAMAAMVALAVVAGALGGALATAGLSHLVADDATSSGNRALEASVARIDADMLALKASVEQTSRTGMSQFNKTGDRLDKIEKAQAEPIVKLAKLTEAVDKLRAAPAAMAAVPVAPKEVTGSVAPPPAAPAAPKVEVGKLPTVEGWVLTDVGYGGALIENRRRSYEVYAGDNVRGLGRIDAIRKQDGRWVVVTSKGLITSR